jgi:immune inhibitor A
VRRSIAGLLSLAVASTVGVSLTAPAAGAPRPVAGPDDPTGGRTAAAVDDLPSPLEDKRRELREVAITQVVNGDATPVDRGVSTVVKVGETPALPETSAPGVQAQPRKDQYVELARETTDRIFVILAEFGNERHPDYPDQDTAPAIPGPLRFDGPLHNEIPEPDRSVDNSTIWEPDFNRAYFERIYFGTGEGDESLKQYYEKQSSGRYSVDGVVTDWVKVRYNEARYGRSNGYPCGGNVCSNTWFLIQDAVNQWVADQQAAGRTDAQIAAELKTFDVWDRYDYDGDGNFNEPDYYIDHFQIVHAGGDQADGDPWQAEDAIWSHRWYAFFPGAPGSPPGPPQNPLGGTQIDNLGLWVGDYTIQPENGGRSVFYHEYGHDLGLPDLYDTSGGGDNIGWWSIMAQSRLSDENDQGIGTRGADLGPWEKIQLGWFDYEITVAGQQRTMWLGPHEYNSPRPQGLVTVLPDKQVVTNLITPYAGARSWYSGHQDDYTATMTRSVNLSGATSAELRFQAAYDIEDCGPDPCDYAYVEVDADNDGSGWTAIPGSITKAAEGNAIDGTQKTWVPATFNLSAYAGQTIGLRFRYTTDGAVGGNDPTFANGLFVDAIEITADGAVIFSDGAEAGANGWTLVGFTAVGATLTTLHDNFYISSHRNYVSYDQYLESGPYNFGFLNTRPDWVEHFSYMEGLLIWYWDTSQSDNNTSEHPGEGLILPIDSHPRPIYNLQGVPWRCRIQVYDAPFSLTRAESFTLHVNSAPSYIRGQDAVPVFDDRRTYFYDAPTIRLCGVKVPDAGVRIRVLEVDGTSIRIRQTSTAE